MSDRAILRGNSFQKNRAKNNVSWHYAFTCGSNDSQSEGLHEFKNLPHCIESRLLFREGRPSKYNPPDYSVLTEGNSEESPATATSEMWRAQDSGHLKKARSVGFWCGGKGMYSKWW